MYSIKIYTNSILLEMCVCVCVFFMWIMAGYLWIFLKSVDFWRNDTKVGDKLDVGGVDIIKAMPTEEKA